MNRERYRVSLRIQKECGKISTRKNSVFGHFSRSFSSYTKESSDPFSNHLITSSYFSNLNSCHINMSITIETKQNNELSIVDVNVVHGLGKFQTNVYQQTNFRSLYTHFHSLLPNAYKICMIPH